MSDHLCVWGKADGAQCSPVCRAHQWAGQSFWVGVSAFPPGGWMAGRIQAWMHWGKLVPLVLMQGTVLNHGSSACGKSLGLCLGLWTLSSSANGSWSWQDCLFSLKLFLHVLKKLVFSVSQWYHRPSNSTCPSQCWHCIYASLPAQPLDPDQIEFFPLLVCCHFSTPVPGHFWLCMPCI